VFSRLLAPGFSLPRLPGLVSQCAVCRSWPARQVCEPCVARFMPRLLRCARCALVLSADLSEDAHLEDPLCATCTCQAPPLDGTLAAVAYAYPWSTLITRYKFGEQHGWAGFFASLMRQTPGVAQRLDELSPQDWIIPLPLSAQRLQTRGFNQAWELASALARQSATPAQADARLLLRMRHTQAQTKLRREDRLANVRGAFQVDPLRVPSLQGRAVVLVDDVMTSGASLFEAARTLREAGAASVTALVLARTAPA
jgi:ComF family protein